MADEKNTTTPAAGKEMAAGPSAAQDPALQATEADKKAIERAMKSLALDSYVIEQLYMKQAQEAAAQTVKITEKAIEEVNRETRTIHENVAGLLNSEEWAKMRGILRGILEAAPQWLEYAKDTAALYDYLEEELKKPKYNGASVDDLLDAAEIDENGDIVQGSLFYQALEAAKEAKREAEEKAAPVYSTVKHASAIEYPTDKPNSNTWANMWRLLLKADADGQFKLDFDMANEKDKRQGKKVPIFYSVNFGALDDVQAVKKLTIFDKRVYLGVAALFNAGNTAITASQIYTAMGNTGKGGKSDREKIVESVKKMARTWICFNNEKEAEIYKRYVVFKYEGYLLPCEFHSAYINGKYADTAICVYREPPLITFAKQRDQIATIDIKLLQSPINKTETNMLIDDYLIVQISRLQRADDAKKKAERTRRGRILYKTIFEKCGVPVSPRTETERSQHKRGKKRVGEYLSYYCECGKNVGPHPVSRYETDRDGVTIYW